MLNLAAVMVANGWPGSNRSWNRSCLVAGQLMITGGGGMVVTVVVGATVVETTATVVLDTVV